MAIVVHARATRKLEGELNHHCQRTASCISAIYRICLSVQGIPYMKARVSEIIGPPAPQIALKSLKNTHVDQLYRRSDLISVILTCRLERQRAVRFQA
jgi:hypothetical protein